jgi:hypothetical protein
MITVPGQPALLAVTTAGTAAFPPTQLVIVTAPAEPAATSPSVMSSRRLSAAVLSDTRVEALSLTSRASLSRIG